MALGQLDTLAQIALVLLVQIIGQIDEYLRFEHDGHIGAFYVVQVQAFYFLFDHELAVSRQKRAQANQRLVFHVHITAGYEMQKQREQVLFRAQFVLGKLFRFDIEMLGQEAQCEQHAKQQRFRVLLYRFAYVQRALQVRGVVVKLGKTVNG